MTVPQLDRYVLACMALLLATLFSGCSEPESAATARTDPFSGTVSDSAYSNPYFGITIPVLKGWKVLPTNANAKGDSAQLARLYNKIPGSESLKKGFKWVLFLQADTSFYKDTYATVRVLVEDLTESGHSARDYMEYTQRWIESGDTTLYPKYEHAEIKKRRLLGGKSMWTQTCVMWAEPELDFVQFTACHKVGDYLLVVQLTTNPYKEDVLVGRELLQAVEWL